MHDVVRRATIAPRAPAWRSSPWCWAWAWAGCSCATPRSTGGACCWRSRAGCSPEDIHAARLPRGTSAAHDAVRIVDVHVGVGDARIVIGGKGQLGGDGPTRDDHGPLPTHRLQCTSVLRHRCVMVKHVPIRGPCPALASAIPACGGPASPFGSPRQLRRARASAVCLDSEGGTPLGVAPPCMSVNVSSCSELSVTEVSTADANPSSSQSSLAAGQQPPSAGWAGRLRPRPGRRGNAYGYR